jgi:3'-phosphoadenosine 5'-phosphosulfate sulfotransferase
MNDRYQQEEQFRMRIFEARDGAIHSQKGEFLLGFRETGSHACYMIYGILKPKEKARLVKPGPGHEEIVLAMKGNLEVAGYYSGSLKEGSAFQIEGEQECFLENRGKSDAVYIIAGGHSEAGRH